MLSLLYAYRAGKGKSGGLVMNWNGEGNGLLVSGEVWGC